jgi:hypothetical protein
MNYLLSFATLAGLWYGEEKLRYPALLTWFYKTCPHLSTNGLKIRNDQEESEEARTHERKRR